MNANDEVPFTAIVGGVNEEVMLGADGVLTVSVAVVELPLPPSVDVTTLVVLSLVPAVVPVTVTLNEHCALAAMVAPVIEILPGAVSVTVPPQTAALAFGTVTPAGKVLVKLTPVSELPALGFVIVNDNDEVAFTAIVVGLNEEAMLGADGVLTVRIAVVELPLPPSFEFTTLVVLTLVPAVVPVVVTLNTHWPLAAMVAPVIVMLPGAVNVTVPPQMVALAFGTVRPAGNVLVKPTPVIDVPASVLVIVNVNCAVPLTRIVVGLNDEAMLGGEAARAGDAYPVTSVHKVVTTKTIRRDTVSHVPSMTAPLTCRIRLLGIRNRRQSTRHHPVQSSRACCRVAT
nr:hypothetical protein [Bradyrhizobium manausense]